MAQLPDGLNGVELPFRVIPGPAGNFGSHEPGEVVHSLLSALSPADLFGAYSQWSNSSQGPNPVPLPSRDPGSGAKGHQEFADTFCSGPWLSMCHTYEQPIFLADDESCASFMARCNVARVLQSDFGNQETGKVPFLAARIAKLEQLESGARALLQDLTGYLGAEVHPLVLKQRADDFLEGAVVVIRKASVYQPVFAPQGCPTHTLVLTAANIEHVFPRSEPVPQALASQVDAIRKRFLEGPALCLGDTRSVCTGSASETATALAKRPVLPKVHWSIPMRMCRPVSGFTRIHPHPSRRS